MNSKYDELWDSQLRHIIMKLSKAKDKEKILKIAREKQIATQKASAIRFLADSPTET